MQKAYTRINWQNYPAMTTPLNEENLNKIDASLNEVDDRVLKLDTTKLDLSTANTMVKSVSFDPDTGIFTIESLNGSKLQIDTKLEKLAVNWFYDEDEKALKITLDDGTVQTVDLADLIDTYTFLDSETIAFECVGGDVHRIRAIVKKGSVTGEHLEPNYLANVTAQAEEAARQAGEAEESAIATAGSAKEAAASASAAEKSQKDAESSASSAVQSAAASAQSAGLAEQSKTAADESAIAANRSAATASEKAGEAADSALSAAQSKNAAANSAIEAADSAEDATESEIAGKGYRDEAKRYADQLGAALDLIVPAFRIDFATGCLVSDTAAQGMEFELRNGDFIGRTV